MKNSTLALLLLLLSSAASIAQQYDPAAFVTTWEVTATDPSITIPANSSHTYSYTVDWGDNTTSTSHTGNANHTYPSSGMYTVSIIGDFPRVYFNNAGDKDKIQTIEQWGDIQWQSMLDAFEGCTNLQVIATDAPDLTQATNLRRMFRGARSITGNNAFNSWNVSKVEDMSFMFDGATAFNGAISNWDVRNVTDMNSMFSFAAAFNQDIGGWNLSSITSMTNLFRNSAMDCTHYSATLIGWAANPNTAENLTLDNITYGNYAADAISTLQQDKRWTIGGNEVADCGDPFVTTWKVAAGDEITIPTNENYIYAFTVDWGDGSLDTTIYTDPATHTYTSAGTDTISVTGYFPGIEFNNVGGKYNIQTVEQLGDILWQSKDMVTTLDIGDETVTLTIEDIVQLEIYPNPINDRLHIHSTQPVTVSLMDLNGKLLISEQEGKQITLDLLNLKSGMYLLIQKKGNKISMRKILKD